MIGRSPGRGRVMRMNRSDVRPARVDAIERKHGPRSGKARRPVQVVMHAPERLVQRSRRRALPPCVHVAEKNGRTLEVLAFEKRLHLSPARAIDECEMRRGDGNRRSAAVEKRHGRGALLEAAQTKVDRVNGGHRPARQDGIAELAEPVNARRDERQIVAEFLGDL